MEDLSLHILDVAENSIDAGADTIQIKIMDKEAEDKFILQIKDNGKGMSREMINNVLDPFFTTKTVRRFGLGIPLLAQAADECNGRFLIESEEGKGTLVTAEFQRSHIDRKPLGDMGATMMVLVGGHPEIDFEVLYEKEGFSYRMDTKELRAELDGLPLNLPRILQFIKDDMNEALMEVY